MAFLRVLRGRSLRPLRLKAFRACFGQSLTCVFCAICGLPVFSSPFAV